MLNSKSYDVRVNSLRAIIQHLDGTVLKVNSRLMAKLYSALDMNLDKATAPLIHLLVKFLSKQTKKDVALYAVQEGALLKIH